MAFSISEIMRKILGSTGLFSGSSPSVVGVDIGASSIKVVQIKRKGGRPILETYGELALGPYAGTEVGRATNLAEDKVIEALRDLFKEANVTSRSGAIAIPLGSSLISLVSMPKLPEARMREMIPLEARRYIPVPISEVTLDWWILPDEEQMFKSPDPKENEIPSGAKVDVLLVAILNDAVGRFRRIAEGVGLTNPTFEMEIFSSVRASVGEGVEPIMMLDLGAGNTKVYLVHHGVVKDAHTIPRGSQDITLSLSRSLSIPTARAEEIKRSVGLSPDPKDKGIAEASTVTAEYILSEASRALLSFEKKFHKTVSKVILTGGGAALKGFAELARTRFPAPVEIADPFKKLVTPAFLSDVLRTVGPEFSVAVGAALRRLSEES